MGRKVLFLDIDGTLTDVEGKVPASAVSAVRRARENGVLCVINTGRPFSHIVEDVKEIGFDGFICSCGQHLLYEGKTVFRHRADRAYSQYVARTAKECCLDLFAEAEEGVWGIFFCEPRGAMQSELSRFKKRGLSVYASAEEGDFILDKFCVWRFPEGDTDTFTEAVSDRYTSTGSESMLLEYVLNGHSKQTGAEAFLRLVGADKADAFAIGDSANDLPMFRAVAHSAAMCEGAPRLISIAEYVTGPVRADGVEQALRHFKLI